MGMEKSDIDILKKQLDDPEIWEKPEIKKLLKKHKNINEYTNKFLDKLNIFKPYIFRFMDHAIIKSMINKDPYNNAMRKILQDKMVIDLSIMEKAVNQAENAIHKLFMDVKYKTAGQDSIEIMNASITRIKTICVDDENCFNLLMTEIVLWGLMKEILDKQYDDIFLNYTVNVVFMAGVILKGLEDRAKRINEDDKTGLRKVVSRVIKKDKDIQAMGRLLKEYDINGDLQIFRSDKKLRAEFIKRAKDETAELSESKILEHCRSALKLNKKV
jgi:hypothetical protein